MSKGDWEMLAQMVGTLHHKRALDFSGCWDRKTSHEPGHPPALRDNKFPSMTSRRQPRRKRGNHG